jgi:anti-sigma regulatory factor (Ser/Thr protein kinase)
MSCNVIIPVSDISQIGEARRAGVQLSSSQGLGETDAGRVAIVVTELATNLVRHGRGGEILLSSAEHGAMRGVNVCAMDQGPGMSDPGRCLQDGFSTAGTPGNGLGAVKRLSNRLDLYSSPSGTVIWSRIVGQESDKAGQRAVDWGAVCVPVREETACGDTWKIAESGEYLALVVADGLGHGPLAAEASQRACATFEAAPFEEPVTCVEASHRALSATRGAAVAVARLELQTGKLAYAAVGNISGTLLDDQKRQGLFSHNGTVGHHMRKAQQFEYDWKPGCIMVMHSDGVQTRWDLEKYPGLARRHPAVIAGVLYRDFKRGRDDATVVVVSYVGTGGS